MLSWVEHEKSFIVSGPVNKDDYHMGRLKCTSAHENLFHKMVRLWDVI